MPEKIVPIVVLLAVLVFGAATAKFLVLPKLQELKNADRVSVSENDQGRIGSPIKQNARAAKTGGEAGQKDALPGLKESPLTTAPETQPTASAVKTREAPPHEADRPTRLDLPGTHFPRSLDKSPRPASPRGQAEADREAPGPSESSRMMLSRRVQPATPARPAEAEREAERPVEGGSVVSPDLQRQLMNRYLEALNHLRD